MVFAVTRATLLAVAGSTGSEAWCGSNTIVRTSGRSCIARSIRTRTSAQASPPSPAPKGGMAMEEIPRELVPPVALGRKVDDVARRNQLSRFEHEHASRPNFLLATGSYICLEIVRPGFLELQGDSPAHGTDAVDGVSRALPTSSSRMLPVLYSTIPSSSRSMRHRVRLHKVRYSKAGLREPLLRG